MDRLFNSGVAAAALGLAIGGSVAHAAAAAEVQLQARVLVTGLPGVQGVRQVGRFHAGGAIPSNPDFLLQTQPGRVLDPERLLVAVSSNLGAPRADAAQAPGAVLSIDPARAHALRLPPVLGASGQQAAMADGAVQIYSASSTAFSNRHHNPGAATAPWAAVAGPRYLSINNAFGRPWIANAATSDGGAGSLSVVDPNGAPLANPPSAVAGGVFAGAHTNRRSVPLAVRSGFWAGLFNQRESAQLTPGSLNHAVLGTAFLGPSPDGGGLAVFATVTADGAVQQAHVQDGVDGLAPPGTVAPLAQAVNGLVFKWNPLPALLLADPGRNRVQVLQLAHDGRHFTLAGVQSLQRPEFNVPVDIAAAVPEVANPRFASHTTLAGAADLYMANRGDGRLLRIDTQGQLLAQAIVRLPDGQPIAPGRLRAIAVSADAQRLWITVAGERDDEGLLLEVPAFGVGGGVAAERLTAAASAAIGAPRGDGASLFARRFSAAEGLGPRFNATSCLECHASPSAGGMSSADEHFVRRVARIDNRSGRVQPLPGGAFAPRHGVHGVTTVALPMPAAANVVSLRMPPALYALGRIDEIPDAVIEAQARAKGDGVQGRVHRVRGPDGQRRVGRYGWKADVATLELMVADAFANELGLSNALHTPASDSVEDDGRIVRAVAEFLRGLRPPPRAQP